MAKKISELASATAIADADLVVIVQSGSSKKATGAVLKETIFGAIDAATVQAEAEDANLFVLRDGTDTKSISLLSLKQSVLRGTIQLWGAAAAPTGALLCTGQAVSRTTYASLFAIIGTTFGVGDNSTTFNVPNFQGVVPKGVGSQTINTRPKSGPVLGAVQEDQFQGHLMAGAAGNPGSKANFYIGNSAGTIFPPDGAILVTDGTNGTPRVGATTQENCLGINFIIWY